MKQKNIFCLDKFTYKKYFLLNHNNLTFYNQAKFEIRCEWGKKGVEQLAPISDVIIIADVLSFSTCIEIANSRGAIVFPYDWKNESAQEFARSINAELATRRGGNGYSLSPASLNQIEYGRKISAW